MLSLNAVPLKKGVVIVLTGTAQPAAGNVLVKSLMPFGEEAELCVNTTANLH